MKVSVIVPVYNVEKYLRKCLDSLVNQTIDNYEVIIVNDGSKDESEKIINEYKNKYSCIKAYKKENGGMSSARNYGLKYAKGEYIAFTDSDDFIEENMLEEMYNKAKKDDSDVVICDYYAINEQEKRYIKCHLNLSSDLKCEYLLSPPMVWSKLIKKEVMDKEKFTEKIYYEDLDICPRLFKHIKKISFVDKPLYNYYVQHSGSIMTQKKFTQRLLDIFTVLDNNKKILINDYFDELEYMYITNLLRTATLRFLDYPNTSEYLNKINNIMKNEFPNWKENKYYKKASKKAKLICFCAIHRLYLPLKIVKKLTGRR